MTKLVDGDAVVEIAAERGGMVTRFAVGPREVLYLDEATLRDPTKNVRGGNPVLFPSPGPLANERFTWGVRSGSMKQHGFARNRPWRVTESDARSAILELASDDVTRAQFPWDFTLRYRHVLAGARLRIEQRIENRSDDSIQPSQSPSGRGRPQARAMYRWPSAPASEDGCSTRVSACMRSPAATRVPPSGS